MGGLLTWPSRSAMRCFLSSKSALDMKTSSAHGSLSAWSLHAAHLAHSTVIVLHCRL